MISLPIGLWDKLIREPDGLWYAHEAFWPMIERFFVNPPDNMSGEMMERKERILDYFTDRLSQVDIVLGKRDPYFNDDERYIPGKGMQLPLQAVVIHHSATSNMMTRERLNALHLLRLYCPVYKNVGFFKKDGQLQPISSGHYTPEGVQVFYGYHWGVYNGGRFDGAETRLLDDKSVGFHAGHPPTNWSSIGIVVIDDLTDTIPTVATINTINKIISHYPDVIRIIGHKEVPGRETIVCPGKRWDEWKPLLRLP